MTPFAHAGHWAVQLLYVLPVLAVVFILVRARLRDRRRRQGATDSDGQG